MKKAALTLSLAALAAAGLAAPSLAQPRPTPEAQLAKALAGRVAGKPVDCIDPRTNSTTRIIDRTAIIYGSGRTIYLQRPDNPSVLRRDDVLVTTLRGSGMLCHLDIVHLHDQGTHFERGSIGLNPFVPYTLVGAAGRD